MFHACSFSQSPVALQVPSSCSQACSQCTAVIIQWYKQFYFFCIFKIYTIYCLLFSLRLKEDSIVWGPIQRASWNVSENRPKWMYWAWSQCMHFILALFHTVGSWNVSVLDLEQTIKIHMFMAYNISKTRSACLNGAQMFLKWSENVPTVWHSFQFRAFLNLCSKA